MRRAQLRLRQITTMAAVALLVALATLSAPPRQHTGNVAARITAQEGPIQRLPGGRRWY